MRVLQHVAEASGGREWINIYPHPMVHTADLVEAFMMTMEVWHEVRDVARCWGEPPDLHPTQPQVQEFVQVTTHLDSMVTWVPSQRAFDELVYPPYELHNCRSCHYVVGGVMDLEESMPPTEVVVYDNGRLLSQGCSLLFKGWVLVYDLQNDCAEWVRFRGSASDLSDMEIASTEELSVYVPSEAVRGVARLDCLTEKQMETSPMNVAYVNPIDTSDSEESVLEEDPEPVGDLHDIILDERGEDQPCPVRRAADSVMDPPAEVVADAPSPDTAALHIEEGPEQADDLCNVILDKRGKDQPCPVRRAADSVMDTQAEAVANALSMDTAALPTEEALSEPTPPTSGPTETQDLGTEDVVVLLCEEEMTDFP